ncbi:MAG: hypothetical protein JKY88_14180 [Pseudomonadales bacterium]|nr:hypothetical protein [Pseudomonadales bacterium]
MSPVNDVEPNFSIDESVYGQLSTIEKIGEESVLSQSQIQLDFAQDQKITYS